MISSAVPHSQLFLTGQEEDFSDEQRKLMDDLNIQHGSVSVLYHSADVHLLSVTDAFHILFICWLFPTSYKLIFTKQVKKRQFGIETYKTLPSVVYVC